MYKNISEIPFDDLRKAGFKYLVFDKDNTLTKHDSLELEPVVIPTFKKLRADWAENMVLFSNNLDAEGVILENRFVRDLFTVSYKSKSLKKPFCGEALRKHFQMVHPNEKPDLSKCVIIGDRLLTDMCLGNVEGGLSILVLPFDTSNEQPGIQTLRKVEEIIWGTVFSYKLKKHRNRAIEELADRTAR